MTISPEDIAAMGVTGKPQTGRITLREFKGKGIYQVPRSPGDPFSYIHLKEFREDPAAHPLDTPSGKLEIHCQAIAELVRNCGWMEIDPIPKYTKPCEGYEDTFSGWETGTKGEYPLQFYSIHVLSRAHSCLDNVAWLREAFPHELLMNPADAASRGISTGENVLVRSRHGAVRRPVRLTERMMPGVVALGQGAWVAWDDEAGLDQAGSVNVLIGAIPTGQGHGGYNSCNVQVLKE